MRTRRWRVAKSTFSVPWKTPYCMVTVIFLMAFVSRKTHIFLKKEKNLEGHFALSIIKNTWLQKNGHLNTPLPGRVFPGFSQNRVTAYFSEKSLRCYLPLFFTSWQHFPDFCRSTSPLCFLGYAKTLKWLQLFMGGPQRIISPSNTLTHPNLNTQAVAMTNKAELQKLLFHS